MFSGETPWQVHIYTFLVQGLGLCIPPRRMIMIGLKGLKRLPHHLCAKDENFLKTRATVWGLQSYSNSSSWIKPRGCQICMINPRAYKIGLWVRIDHWADQAYSIGQNPSLKTPSQTQIGSEGKGFRLINEGARPRARPASPDNFSAQAQLFKFFSNLMKKLASSLGKMNI